MLLSVWRRASNDSREKCHRCRKMRISLDLHVCTANLIISRHMIIFFVALYIFCPVQDVLLLFSQNVQWARATFIYTIHVERRWARFSMQAKNYYLWNVIQRKWTLVRTFVLSLFIGINHYGLKFYESARFVCICGGCFLFILSSWKSQPRQLLRSTLLSVCVFLSFYISLFTICFCHFIFTTIPQKRFNIYFKQLDWFGLSISFIGVNVNRVFDLKWNGHVINLSRDIWSHNKGNANHSFHNVKLNCVSFLRRDFRFHFLEKSVENILWAMH